MADSRNEPSMDEILSSIKKIIADEDRARPAARKKPVANAPRTPEKADQDEVLELTERAEAADESDVLLDDSKAENLARSFSTLQTLAEPAAAPQIVRTGETSLEELTRELMRPMLKQWIDANLPDIVESMVEREIARITKKG